MFLEESTYFFKIKAFAKNFPKERATGKYARVDFAYLRELAVLDAHLRKLIVSIALDVEHFLKVGLIKDVSENSKEDGYEVVKEFFAQNPAIHTELLKKKNTSYCKDLVEKMEEEGYALWNVIEVLSFGQFITLYRMYSEKYGLNRKTRNLLFPAKSIRNAAAHNNCLLNSLQCPYSYSMKPCAQLDSYLSQIPSLKKSKSRKTKLQNPVIHDFIALLYLFDKVCTSVKTKQYTYKQLYDLFHVRMMLHAEYFAENAAIVSSYRFVVKVVDFLYNKVYNDNVEQKSI